MMSTEDGVVVLVADHDRARAALEQLAIRLRADGMAVHIEIAPSARWTHDLVQRWGDRVVMLVPVDSEIAMAPCMEVVRRAGGAVASTECDDEVVALVSREARAWEAARGPASAVFRRWMESMSTANLDAYDDAFLRRRLARQRQHSTPGSVLNAKVLSPPRRFLPQSSADQMLREVVLPLVDALQPDEVLRCWVATCGSGEEAYLLAMLAHEAITLRGRSNSVQIFATDGSPGVVGRAAEGWFRTADLRRLGDERIARWFTPDLGGMRADKQLRDALVFAPHDIINGAPFTRLHLVQCGHPLHALRPAYRERVLRMFQVALRPRGLLCLGAPCGDVLPPGMAGLWSMPGVYTRVDGPPTLPPHDVAPTHLTSAAADESVFAADLRRHGGACLFIDAAHRIFKVLGNPHPFVRHNAGVEGMDVRATLLPELSVAVAAASSRVQRERQAVRYTHLPLDRHGTVVDLRVSPVRRSDEDRPFTMVTIVRARPAPSPTPSDDHVLATQTAELEDELASTRLDLQSIISELQTAHDQAQRTNASLASSNTSLRQQNDALLASNEVMYDANQQRHRHAAALRAWLHQVHRTLDDLAPPSSGPTHADRERVGG